MNDASNASTSSETSFKATTIEITKPVTICGNCEDALNNQDCPKRSRGACLEHSRRELL